jgi:hypothetical protein
MSAPAREGVASWAQRSPYRAACAREPGRNGTEAGVGHQQGPIWALKRFPRVESHVCDFTMGAPTSWCLARRKIAIAEKIGGRALRADAIEAVTCGWLSFVVVISLAVQLLVGAWWIGGAGSLAIVWFLVKEGREAWSGQGCDVCC